MGWHLQPRAKLVLVNQRVQWQETDHSKDHFYSLLSLNGYSKSKPSLCINLLTTALERCSFEQSREGVEKKEKDSMLGSRIRHQDWGLEIIWEKMRNLKRAPSKAGDA